MIESFDSSFEPEKSPEVKKITKEEVIDAYRKFVEQGFKHPDDLDLENPAVKGANELFEQWRAQQQAREKELARGDEEEMKLAESRNNLSYTMLNVDAGFTDPDYLDEVLEWLNAELDGLGKEREDSQKRAEIRLQITEAIGKVERLLQ